MKTINEQFDEFAKDALSGFEGDFNIYLSESYALDAIKQFYNDKISKLLEKIVGEEISKKDIQIAQISGNVRAVSTMISRNKKRQEYIDKINKSEFRDLIN